MSDSASGGRLIHMEAKDVDARWIGRDLMVTDSQTGLTVHGWLSDVEQHPTHHRTVLWLGGHPVVDVKDTSTVTCDTLGAIGGTAA
jgi:hypothetical protein